MSNSLSLFFIFYFWRPCSFYFGRVHLHSPNIYSINFSKAIKINKYGWFKVMWIYKIFIFHYGMLRLYIHVCVWRCQTPSQFEKIFMILNQKKKKKKFIFLHIILNYFLEFLGKILYIKKNCCFSLILFHKYYCICSFFPFFFWDQILYML